MTKKPLYIILLLLLSCCKNFENIELGKPEDIRVTGLKGNVLEMEILMPVTNPTSVNFKIKEVDLKTSVNNHYIGRIINDQVIVIPAKSNELQKFKLKLKIANIIQGVAIILDIMNQDDIMFQMEGYIKFKSLLINKKFFVEETIHINSFK